MQTKDEIIKEVETTFSALAGVVHEASPGGNSYLREFAVALDKLLTYVKRSEEG